MQRPSLLGRAIAIAFTMMIVSAVFAPTHHGSATATVAVTYTSPPTADQRAVVDWAVGRFVDAGLRLPDLTISFPAACGGKGGRYLVGQFHLELCSTGRLIVLHELAHAWDDHNEVDRDRFLEARDLEHWYERDGGPGHRSGGEQLARIVAWGLMDIDTLSRTIEYPGQPVEDQPRSLPGVPGLTEAGLRDLFSTYTGVEPLRDPVRTSPPTPTTPKFRS